MTRKSKQRRSPSGRGVLFVVGLLFGLSAVVRVSIGAAPAIAREVSQLADLRGEQESAQCEIEPDLAAILADLKTREEFLDKKDADLRVFEHALTLTEERIALNLVALEAAERDLEAMVALSEEASENDLARLTAVYENMKPKDAADLFSQMDPEFAAGFVGRMRADAAAAIMTGLPPETAYSISVILAGRNANAPTQ